MLVLIGCEFSGVVRRAFRALGHDAYSCDLRPAEDGSPYHFQMDLLELLADTFLPALKEKPREARHTKESRRQWPNSGAACRR